jgi:hypothetical protein
VGIVNAPALAVTDETTGYRRYIHPKTGETVPSVTTIQKILPKPALVPWAAKMAAEHACANWGRLSKMPETERIYEIKTAYKDYSEKRADIGTEVHSLIDCWSTGRAFPEVSREAGYFADSFIKFMTAIRPEFIENEVTVWSRTHGYAGTADFIARIDGKIVLGDVKTGKRLYPEIGLQLSALAHADFIIRSDGSEEPLPGIEAMAGLLIRPRSWKLEYVKKSSECFRCFLAAREIMEWEQATAPLVLGGLWKSKGRVRTPGGGLCS